MKGSYIVTGEEYKKAIQERDDARKAFEDTKAANDKLTEDLALAKKEVDDLKKKAPKADITELQKKLNAAESEAKKAKDECAELQKKLGVAESEAQKAKDEGAELQKKLNAAESEAKKAKDECAELQKKLTAAEDEVVKAKACGGAAKNAQALVDRVKNAGMTPDEDSQFRKEIAEARAHALNAGNILKGAEDRKSSDGNLLDLLGLGSGIF